LTYDSVLTLQAVTYPFLKNCLLDDEADAAGVMVSVIETRKNNLTIQPRRKQLVREVYWRVRGSAGGNAGWFPVLQRKRSLRSVTDRNLNGASTAGTNSKTGTPASTCGIVADSGVLT